MEKPAQWTEETVNSLAPDKASIRSGRSLANISRWNSLGISSDAVWGECKGSAKSPYQTQIDLSPLQSGSPPAYRCSCPSRKFPCKHALGLLYLLAAKPADFRMASPPNWVSEWLDKRQKRQQQQEKSKFESKRSDQQANRNATRKRAASRESKVATGIIDFEKWLCDLIQQGLGRVVTLPNDYWERAAARLVDAQAPGLARLVRKLPQITNNGQGWETHFLENISYLYMAVSGYKNIKSLDPDLQADLRQLIGWTFNKKSLLEQKGLWDRWLVLGHQEGDEFSGPIEHSPVISYRRTWLWGSSSLQYVYLLDFSIPGQGLPPRLPTGESMEAELVFYPGTQPKRAIVKDRKITQPNQIVSAGNWGYSNFDEAVKAYSTALVSNPWQAVYPFPLLDVSPKQVKHAWYLIDHKNEAVEISNTFNQVWQLTALSGGLPLDVICEYDRKQIHPLSARIDDRWVDFLEVK